MCVSVCVSLCVSVCVSVCVCLCVCDSFIFMIIPGLYYRSSDLFNGFGCHDGLDAMVVMISCGGYCKPYAAVEKRTSGKTN